MRHITLGHLDVNVEGRTYVDNVLDTNRLSYGPYTKRFENEFAALHGCEHGVFLNSGTSALQVALATLREVHGYQDGDEVLVPAITFIATSNIVIQNNLKPVFVDVDPATFNMDPTKVKEKITSRTRAIIPVHLFGLPANMSSIMRIANANFLQVIEDSCETVAATCDARSVGSFGDIATFSTYVAHLVVGGVGGVITTNNPQLAEISRSFMAHGRDSIYTNIDQDNTNDESLRRRMVERRFNFVRVGYSYRATEIEAAIALSELHYLNTNLTKRRENAATLTRLLSDLPQLQTPHIPRNMTHSFMMYPMVLNEGSRDELLVHLERNGIETRYMFPLLSQPIYRQLFPALEQQYPVAEKLARQGFFIGMHQGLVDEDIMYVSDVVHRYFKEHR